MVANRFCNFARTLRRSTLSDRFFFLLFIFFFTAHHSSAEDSRTKITITAVRFARQRRRNRRLLSSSIDTVSSDSRRTYVLSREMYRLPQVSLLYEFTADRSERFKHGDALRRVPSACAAAEGRKDSGVTRPELMRNGSRARAHTHREKGFMHHRR